MSTLVWLSPSGELLLVQDFSVESELHSLTGSELFKITIAAIERAGFECLGEL